MKENAMRVFLGGAGRWALTLVGVCAFLWTSNPVVADTALKSFASTDNVEAELMAETLDVAAGSSFFVALRQKIRPGWHTYWQNPGDSGAPTTIEWDMPTGFAASDIYWPAPERIPVGPLINFGYKDEIFLLARITAPRDLGLTMRVALKAHVRWLVCEEICIPEEVDMMLDLPVTRAAPLADPVSQAEIKRARSLLPQAAPWETTASLEGDRVVLALQGAEWFSVFSEGRVVSASFFPYAEGLIANAPKQELHFGKNGFAFMLTPGYKVENNQALPEGGLDGVVVLTQRPPAGGAVKRASFTVNAAIGGVPEGVMDQALTPPAQSMITLSLGAALLFALLGGLLLNLMPCVLPVLSMKALSLVQSAQKHPAEARASGLAYAAGVVLTFLVIAAGLVALRSAGEQIGWGFQLQSPVFVTAMTYLIFMVGLNLSGVFDIGQPLANMGGALVEKSGRGASFFTGVLASLVATPCTAPFMGAAVGYAVFQPSAATFLIFGALGLGMALPYLALSFTPSAARLLPRPGLWMVRLRQGLAFPMYATAAWLIWVLSQQTNANGVFFALLGLVLLGFAAWVYQASAQAKARGRMIGRAFAVLALAAALALLAPQRAGVEQVVATSETPTEGALSFEPYSPDSLAAYRAQGKAVFVNFTAAWCVTCLVNERLALNTDQVIARFAQDDIVYLKGDWTNSDPVITKALARYGRNGVPLYLLYAPGGVGEADAVVLPQILTPSIVISAIDGL